MVTFRTVTILNSIVFICVLGTGLAGCTRQQLKSEVQSEPTTTIDASVLAPKKEEQYTLKDDERAVSPVAARDNVLPRFPTEISLEQDRVVLIRVRLIVDERGKVTSVLPLDPPEQDTAPFVTSVVFACQAWNFEPLKRVRYFQKRTPNPDGSIDLEWQTESTSLPFHLDYEFRFQIKNRQAAVSTKSST